MHRRKSVKIVIAVLVVLFVGLNISLPKLSNSINGEDNAEIRNNTDNISVGENNSTAQLIPENTTEPTPTADPNTPEGRALKLGLPKPPEIDINSWEFIMANPDTNIEKYEPPLAKLEQQQFDERIIEPMQAFVEAARNEGLNVFLSSGYRSYNEQNYLFNRKLGQGYSREDAARIVAVPGTSEHQTGLACDITDRYYDFKTSELENTDLYKWMSAHCHEYGFVVRYPKDKEDITKIIYEPWHFRYLGKDAATYMVENNLCYEEFYDLYIDD